MHSSSYHGERQSFENGGRVSTSDFDFDDIDSRLGWSEPTDEPQKVSLATKASNHVAPAINANEPCDVDNIPVASQSEAIIKVLALLLASGDLRLELLTLCASFGLSQLLGGLSFAEMAKECGVSKQAFSRRVLKLQSSFNLSPCRGQKCVAARESYRKKQLEIWQRPERRPQNDWKRVADFAEPPAYKRPLSVTG